MNIFKRHGKICFYFSQLSFFLYLYISFFLNQINLLFFLQDENSYFYSMSAKGQCHKTLSQLVMRWQNKLEYK